MRVSIFEEICKIAMFLAVAYSGQADRLIRISQALDEASVKNAILTAIESVS